MSRNLGIAFLGLLLLAGCGAPTPSEPGTTPTPAASVSPEISALPTLTPSPTASPTATPSATPTVAPTATPTPSPVAFSCQLSGGSAAVRGTIQDVRVGTHPGYDRLVIELSGGVTPYTLAEHSPTGFSTSAKGDQVDVAGGYALVMHLYNQDIPPVFAHGTNLDPGGPVLAQVVVLGDFEGQADFAIGLHAPVCPTVSIYAAPPRLVLDFPTG